MLQNNNCECLVVSCAVPRTRPATACRPLSIPVLAHRVSNNSSSMFAATSLAPSRCVTSMATHPNHKVGVAWMEVLLSLLLLASCVCRLLLHWPLTHCSLPRSTTTGGE